MKNALKKLLSDGILQDIPLVNNQYNLLVEEPDNQNKNGLKEFTIIDLPADSIVFSLDYRLSKGKIKQHVANSRVKNFSWLIHGGLKDVNQKCDIIIITPQSYYGKDLVIIGELKSNISRSVRLRAKKQIKNSKIILEFIFNLIRKHELGDVNNMEFRKVVFSNDENAEDMNTRSPVGIGNEDAIKYVFVENGSRKHWNSIKYKIC